MRNADKFLIFIRNRYTRRMQKKW